MRGLENPLIGAAFAGLIARVVSQVVLGAFANPETWEYDVVARNLLAGAGYTYEIHGAIYVAALASPLYVALTATIYAVTNYSHLPLLLLQAVFGGATAACAAAAAQRIYPGVAAWVAGCLVALHPGLVVYAAKLHPLTLDALAFTGLFLVCLAAPTRVGYWHATLLGLVAGLGALTRSSILFVVPIAILWLARYRAMRVLSRHTLLIVVISATIFLPWSIRNSVLLGQPVFLSSESTEWLWRGNNPNATGSSWTEDHQLMFEVAPESFRQRVLQADEASRYRLYRDAAWSFILENPMHAAGLYARKFVGFWVGSSSTGGQYPSTWLYVYQAWYGTIALLAFIGVGSGLARGASRSAVVLALLVMATVAATQSVFYVEGRHRWAVEPLLLLLAGGGVSRGVHNLWNMRRLVALRERSISGSLAE